MYQLINQVIIRTPRLPFSFRNRFEEIIQSPSFHEALFFASDSLYRDAFGKGDNSDRMLAALIRYVNRSSTRCTPFGLFAGVSVSEIEYDAAKTSVIIEGNIQKHIRFDMSFICRLSSILANDKDVQNSIYFTSNSTIYKVGKKIRYIETLGNRHLISCSQTSRDLNKILSMSMYGAKIGKLATFLNKAGYDPVSTQEYLEDLVKSQILIGEFQPLVIGEDVFTHIIKVLNRENIQTKIAIFARQIYNKLKSIERRQGDYRKMCEDLRSFILQSGWNFDESHLFQVDFSRSVLKFSISSKLDKNLCRLMSFLAQNGVKNRPKQLQLFIDAFYERYEEQEVPLLEALDPEIGLGYPINANTVCTSPLLTKFVLPQKSKDSVVRIDSFHRNLLNKIDEAIRCKRTLVDLTDEDFSLNSYLHDDLPPIVGMMCELINDMNDDTHIYLKSVGAGCGLNLVTRFAYMDEKIEILVKKMCKMEQSLNSEIVYAEISYLPEARMGNILCRPHIRDYEIILLTSSDIPSEQRIALSDLMISYKEGSLCLRSKRLNKYVVPRLTSAHNFSISNMPVYRFLCDMQMQSPNIYYPLVNLELLFTVHSFVPRIVYNKNIILSLATWHIQIREIRALLEMKNSEELIQKLKTWRASLDIPRFCMLKDGDNNLFIDWNDFNVVQSVFSIIKNRQSIYISEFIFTEQNSIVRDEMGNRYLNECIFFFCNKNSK